MWQILKHTLQYLYSVYNENWGKQFLPDSEYALQTFVHRGGAQFHTNYDCYSSHHLRSLLFILLFRQALFLVACLWFFTLLILFCVPMLPMFRLNHREGFGIFFSVLLSAPDFHILPLQQSVCWRFRSDSE